MKSVEMSNLRTLFFYGTCSILHLACSSQSDDDENKQAASCLLDSTSQKSCWGFVDKSSEVVELIKTKCEDGTGFGSEGTFAYDQCQTSSSIRVV
ncbi:MAG: hypothetical protein AB8G05_24345 [Oligoflexales bacterium]